MYFVCYLSSRKVNNFDKMCDLLVSDKLKSCLSAGALNYVLSLEGNGCFEPDEIAELADTYTNCDMGSTYGSVRSERTEVRSRFSPPKRSGLQIPTSETISLS